MGDYRYTLEPYNGVSTRYICPKCKSRKRSFVRYINVETEAHLSPDVGKCNREIKCGYHYTPKQFFEDNGHYNQLIPGIPLRHRKDDSKNKPISLIHPNIIKESMRDYHKNNFVIFLKNLIGREITDELVKKYNIGTSKHWAGATVFWQMDISGRIRSGKVMLYHTSTGKRVKRPIDKINWAHKLLKYPDFNLSQCLFGEHLIMDSSKPIAVVESEKTAIIASVFMPRFIWVAVGSLSGLNKDRCRVLKGRRVALFPDLNGFEKWNEKAMDLSKLAHIVVSDLLERKATDKERADGLDIADYLIKLRKDSLDNESPSSTQSGLVVPANILSDIKSKIDLTDKSNDTFSWNVRLSIIKEYLRYNELPDYPISLEDGTIINDVTGYIFEKLDIIEQHLGETMYSKYLDQLDGLILFLENIDE